MLVSELVNESREQLENQLRSMCLEYAETIDVGELVEKGYTISNKQIHENEHVTLNRYLLTRHCEPVAYILEKTEVNEDSSIKISLSEVKRWNNE